MKKKKYITSAIILSALIGGSVFASENIKTDIESINWTKKNLENQAKQNYQDVAKEVNKINPDTSISKFGMDVAKTRFKDVVFLGDSITEYLRTQGILNSDSVLAKKGEHLSQAKNHIPRLQKIKPEKVVILYGANDLGMTLSATYKDQFVSLIQNIKKALPHVKIYLQAPMPVYEPNSTKRGRAYTNDNIKMLDQLVKNVAKETGVTYLPSDNIVTSENLYEPDGIHFKYDFYRNWLFFLSSRL